MPTIPVQPLEPAAEKPKAATQLDTIEVTGSRIRRLDYETAQPVLAISHADIERSGATSVAELLQHLSVSGSATNTSVSNNEVGTVEVDLRNLGSQRTLVLVNGRRWVGSMYYYSTSSVDLSTIPLSIIERVEVLKDGASAIYGSDAVAGVVNIITRKDYVGTEAHAQAGSFSQGDGITQNYNVSWGDVIKDNSVFVDLSYGQEGEIHNSDRPLTRFYRHGVGSTRGGPFTPRGTLHFIPTAANGAALGQTLCPTDPSTGVQTCDMILQRGQTITGGTTETTATVASRYQPFNSTSLDPAVNDLYDPNSVIDLSYPNSRLSLFGSLNHAFEGFSLQGEFLYNRRHTDQAHAAYFTQLGDQSPAHFSDVYIAADNPYNPFDQDIGKPDAQGAGSGTFYKEFPELTPLHFKSTVDSYRAGFGLDGDFDGLGRAFNWQTGLVYAESRNRVSADSLRLDHLGLALGPLANCTAAPGCVPLNILGGPGAITAPMLDYITYTSTYPKKQWLADVYATLSNDLFALPAGIVKAAYGLEYRKESYSDYPDALVVSCASDSCFPPTSGWFDVKEEFAELSVPVLSALPLAQQLDLSLAARHSQYNTVGSDTTYKVGLRWKPVDDVLLRATRSSAFRAPAISDLYISSSSFPFTGLTDPCSDYAGQQGGQPASPEVQANCQNAGVPTSYVQPATFQGHDGGNPHLKPETADNYTAGIVFSPHSLHANFYVDWYRIALNNSITLLDPQFTLDSCYQTPGGSQTCSLVTRDPSTGDIADLRYQPLNIGSNHVEGVDFAFDFALPWLQDYGTFKVLMESSYLIENAVLISDASGGLQKTGRQGQETPTNAFPRLKGNSELLWTGGEWKVSWRMRYIHHMLEACDDGISPTLTEIGVCSRPNAADPASSQNELHAVLYHDLQVGYDLRQWNAEVSAGARNLFNQAPPASYTNLYNAFDASTYDLPGVFPYLRFSKTF